MSYLQILLFIAILGFFQNMVFTMVSRSRQSANVKKHFIASIFSNGVWYFMTFGLLFKSLLVTDGDTTRFIVTGLVYALFTATGSITMQAINVGHIYIPYLTEDGKSRVGARIDDKTK